MDATRRTDLLGVKLAALVAEHIATPVDGSAEAFPSGAALLHGDAAWILVDGDATRCLGGALAWAVRRSAVELNVIAEVGGGTVARRAMSFGLPTTVWFAQERTLLPVVAEPLAPPPQLSAEHAALRSIIESAGAQPNVEHGVLTGEVRGLEVCRVVDQPTTGFFADQVDGELPAPPPGLQLEVGVGAADREAFQLMHGDLPTVDALADVVTSVAAVRRADAPQHPLNRLGRERYLRWTAEQQPSLVGLVDLAAAEPPVPRANLKDPTPCVGVGRRADGTSVSVVFSSGVDLDLMPFVADVQATSDRPVIAAVPGRDLVQAIRDLAALLRQPVDFVSLDVSLA